MLDAIRAVAADRRIRQVEFLQRVPTDRWWEVTIAPLPLPGTAPNADRNLILLTLRDLTPLRLVEEMRSDFVANASHELRTPLASLLGFIETLQGSARADAPSRDRFLAIMKEQANRMARLIDDLLIAVADSSKRLTFVRINPSISWRSSMRSRPAWRRWPLNGGSRSPSRTKLIGLPFWVTATN